MQEDPRNYGKQTEPINPEGGTPSNAPGEPMSPQYERTWSMLAHLSVLAGLIGLMPLGALIVWLLYRDRSPRVGFHAAQAFWYQVAWLVIFVVAGIFGVILSIITFGLALFLVLPVGFLVGLIPFIHGCYAAYKVNRGEDFRYPFIADRVDGSGRVL